MIDSFEKKWCQWTVNDALQWFDFILNTKSLNFNEEDDYEIEDYSSSDDEDDEDDEEDETDEKKQEINEKINFQHVKAHLSGIMFNAKEDLSILAKSFQFQRFGFKNKKDSKLLCKKTKQLVKKYPKRIRSKKKASQKKESMHDLESNLEGFVQDTHQASLH